MTNNTAELSKRALGQLTEAGWKTRHLNDGTNLWEAQRQLADGRTALVALSLLHGSPEDALVLLADHTKLDADGRPEGDDLYLTQPLALAFPPHSGRDENSDEADRLLELALTLS